jgi:hypothetical protein
MTNTIQTDDQGEYTVFTGRLCKACGSQLTTRNRHHKSLLCREHGLAAMQECSARASKGLPQEASRKAKRAPMQIPSGPPSDARDSVIYFVIRFLAEPNDPTIFRLFQSAIADYALINGFRRIKPKEGAPSNSDVAVMTDETEDITSDIPDGGPVFDGATAETDSAVPLLGLEGLPVEVPEFDNPEHRTTRLEFLADCAALRV